MVCHGGYGSVLGALAHGVPLVASRSSRAISGAMPGAWAISVPAPPSKALAVAKRRMLDGPDPQALGNLPDAIDAVLHDPGYGRAARDLAEAIAALTPVNAAADLLRAIAAQRTLAPRA